jgi:hypothetical protein
MIYDMQKNIKNINNKITINLLNEIDTDSDNDSEISEKNHIIDVDNINNMIFFTNFTIIITISIYFIQ